MCSLSHMEVFRIGRRNLQMLLFTHIERQQLPLLGCVLMCSSTLSREVQQDKCLENKYKNKKLKLSPENENLKKSWPAKIKCGWIPQTLLLYCLWVFGPVILRRRTSSGIFRYTTIGLGDIRFILKSQSTNPKYHMILEREN